MRSDFDKECACSIRILRYAKKVPFDDWLLGSTYDLVPEHEVTERMGLGKNSLMRSS